MGLCPDEGPSSRPRATNKRVWASVEREKEDVIGDMFEEALRRDPEMKALLGDPGDGGEKQLDLVLGFLRRYRPDVSLILDFIHVLEYLWKAAYSFHCVGTVSLKIGWPNELSKSCRERPPMWSRDCAKEPPFTS